MLPNPFSSIDPDLRRRVLLVVATIALLLLSGGPFYSRTDTPLVQSATVTVSGPSPASGAVQAQAADDSGPRVKITELAVDLPLVQGDGVHVPWLKAATFPALSPPGDGGRSMIYAHAQTGMFGPLLAEGRVGLHIEVDRPDGRVLHYVVREFYPKWPVSNSKWLQPSPHEELILVTCTTFNAVDPRVIAVAEPV